MKLVDVLNGVDCKMILGNKNLIISDICFDSRFISKGCMFAAICGTQVDGHVFISKSIEQGASVVLCSQKPEILTDNVTYVLVENTQKALGYISKNFYGNPTSQLKLIGVTGTNGKTTTATLLYDMFTALGYKCGLISTINYIVCGDKRTSTHTTPDILTINRIFREMINAGCEYCFMEVSSHAVSQCRVVGLEFDIVLFTNITHDHLDYHKTFEHYISAKKTLFDQLTSNAIALYNSDDRNGKVMVQNCSAKLRSFSLHGASDYCCRVIEEHLTGMLIELDREELWVKFIGQFNAYNLLGVYSIAIELGLDKKDILLQLSSLTPVSGRFETIALKNESIAIVDYAHTPDALKNVLSTITNFKTSDRKVITVIGCGGDRDKLKRPIMAKISVESSDFTIFTADNPRTESIDEILSDMLSGVKDFDTTRYITISSREQAIKMGVMLAHQSPKNILLIAGKGHETYQEINGKRIFFDDKEEIRKNTL